MEADYVIVGAGSAGCVLANRLSEDPSVRVALLEAGGRDRNPYIHIPAGFMKLLDHPTITWRYRTEPDADTAGRTMIYPRGRGLGGSSSINGLAYVRSQPEDFDHWAQLGNRGWAYDDILPFFKRSESWVGGEDAVRGGGGPLRVSRQVETPVLCEALIEAGTQVGLERRDDINSRHPGGIGYVQMTRRGRFRQSTARAYLAPASKRPNLQVLVHAQARKLLFEGKRATGVEFQQGATVQHITARRAVILASGAVGSPHLLQVSGVGAPDHLGDIGVTVHHALPGVGQNLNDHYLARISRAVTGTPTANERSKGLALVREVLRYAISGDGILAFSASLVHAYAKVLEESATADMQCAFAPGSFKNGQLGQLDDEPGISGGGWQMRPLVARHPAGALGRPLRGAGDQAALPQPPDRLPCHRRRPQADPEHLRRAGAGALSRRRDPAGPRPPDRRRAARLRAAQRLDRLPHLGHVQDGPRLAGGGRRAPARARPGEPARGRRLGDARCHLDQHQLCRDHDRGKGVRDDQGRRQGSPGGGLAEP